MPTEILMPALSPTMEEGTLAKWLVKEGDEVRSGDVIAEIETDKATMEFEAVDEGVIGKILVAEGTAEVKVNTPIAVLLEEGETASDIADAPPATAPKAQAGAAAEAAPTGGPEKAAPPSPQTSDGTRIFASPLARRIAEQKGLDLAQISGSGPRGRIVKADVEAATASPAPAAKPTAAPASPTATAPVSGGASADAVLKTYADRPYQEIPLDGMRRTIAARLTEAKQTIPHFYLRRDIRLDALMAFRKQLNDQLAARGVKLSVNDFIIKACANALQQVPAANAVWAGDRILQLEPSDVAVAVAIEGGLFTPVLRDAHQKSLSTLSAEMKDLATRARDRKLAPQDYQGGSFAISNLGMFGIENFDAVINPPHGAILAVGAGVKKAVVGADGQVEVATVMSVTLSVDHRVIDGALGADLLRAIVDGLENPLALLA
ncbi:pyruvate dehydrogenase E2 component (dihydrolipoamide acetyltransferase) [Mameliella alba]|uniref:pyruvate dehydrogenase complex dihydrolipoamide acetyltransferase n=1 Tax=Mameliella alba TaxID=561184 RepID=UPI00088293D5|nr:pyruvate dehydrogenase complex dihydrolipoamide acetyltransferase [Mameliella alba]OWV49600.1 pyruvate dehydrogenase complex dihydrolipoamide acetyltransferase [Mameliella alba]PTR41580.1 pyruvate dehydrogenase E2 component (dihydrolipoamide acetyltransferase) [Mameliella alba]GGF52688.1 acetyltransferase component of pyruvate dehydrogenase complex [Mameliella alba]SDC37495.1 pyruvate dehydrogenase E2 component (dihydrolipoamide acetyltransferase) [Mameliella alba]